MFTDAFHCPTDGLYYRDTYSFYTCAGKRYSVLYCAPGSKNRPEVDYIKRDPNKDLKVTDFCSINLVRHLTPEEV